MAVVQLGLKGAMINDHVNGRTFDEPEFLPFWKAAEQMGALIFIHQARPTLVTQRIQPLSPAQHHRQPGRPGRDLCLLRLRWRHGACPDLKVCLAHGGGYTCFGIGRMDRGWQVRSEARVHINKPPSAYLRKFYYDCLTHSEAGPAHVASTPSAPTAWSWAPTGRRTCASIGLCAWVLGLQSLTQEEKENILGKNLERLLGL